MRGNSQRFSILLWGLLLFLAGCVESLTSPDERLSPTPTQQQGKLRHPALLSKAIQPAAAGKTTSSTTLNLIISASSMDKQRVLERYSDMEGYKVLERYDYTNTFSGYAITVEDSAAQGDYAAFLATLEADPDILWYEPDFEVSLPNADTSPGSGGQMVPWSVATIGGMQSWAVSGDGEGNVPVDVYLLDTGVANADVNDPYDDLALVENLDFRGSSPASAADVDGHGTHVAGIIGAVDDGDGIVGVAPGALLHNYKVLNDDGKTDVSVVIAAVERITTVKQANPSKPMVVNLSLGENVNSTAYTALDDAIQASVDAGVVYVVAGGNQGVDASLVTPAHVPGVITVGAHDVDAKVSSFSNRGSMIDLFAPGEDVLSLAPNPVGAFGGLVSMSGTSMAVPHVTGAVALYLAHNPSATPEQVTQALIDQAKPIVKGTPSFTTNKSVWVGEPASSFETRVKASSDDAEEFGDSKRKMYLTSTDLELITDYSESTPKRFQTVGLRFTSLPIPPGATITNAWVQFTTDETSTEPTTLTIHAQAVDDAPAFSSSDKNIYNRSRTLASVSWMPAAWSLTDEAGSNQRTPDLKNVLQEVVSRGNWASGNDVVLLISGTGQRSAHSYNGSSSKAPLLHIEWIGGFSSTDDDDDDDDD
jgi:subtilisin family serine protease